MANSFAELRARYEEFLQAERFDYGEKIGSAVDDFLESQRKGKRAANPCVQVALSDVRGHDRGLAAALAGDPPRHLRALEAAAHEVALGERAGYEKEGGRIRVGLEGDMRAVGPRELSSCHLRRLVCVEGVAVKVSSVKSKLARSVHFCPATKRHEARSYVDATHLHLGLPELDAAGRELPDKLVALTSASYPTKDKDGHALETEFGLSLFHDHQTATLQEMPERAPMGQLPRSVDLVLHADLVDKIKPGDRLQLTGVYRALATASSGHSSSSGLFKTLILVTHLRPLANNPHRLLFTPPDVRAIRSLARRHDLLDLLARSICPSIHGHHVIKKALVLQLLSGVEKNLPNGTHLRGDINILIVGDPSTAKSQLLRSVLSIAPLAISTTGKGSSGVGLTAAVASDPETKQRRLEAGAMVLADRGIVCVDEFDKMGENDRVAIHEAMEQQTVTIAKAGIHASLNARCSVLAAANPVYGHYDRTRRIQDNIGLPDSLLSRFDLLFVVLDLIDAESDRRIAAHVIRGHRYQTSSHTFQHDSDLDTDSSDDEHEPTDGNLRPQAIWQRSRYHLPNDNHDDPHANDALQHQFLRKYLHFAKARIKPVLSEDARECIAQRYAEMRSRQDERTLPITARSLETIIRLASAHAKARLSNVVESSPDVAAAMDILGFALYHENNNVIENTEPKTKRIREFLIPEGWGDDPNNQDEQAAPKRAKLDNAIKETLGDEQTLDLNFEIYTEVSKAMEGLPIEDVCKHVEDREAVLKACQTLDDTGRIMFSDGMLFSAD